MTRHIWLSTAKKTAQERADALRQSLVIVEDGSWNQRARYIVCDEGTAERLFHDKKVVAWIAPSRNCYYCSRVRERLAMRRSA